MALEDDYFNETAIHFSLLLLSLCNQFSSFWEILWNFDIVDTVSLDFLTPTCSHFSDEQEVNEDGRIH
jgi:hypothetical protein